MFKQISSSRFKCSTDYLPNTLEFSAPALVTAFYRLHQRITPGDTQKRKRLTRNEKSEGVQLEFNFNPNPSDFPLIDSGRPDDLRRKFVVYGKHLISRDGPTCFCS